jgi:5S rRNA maturation endonuclease (ribonuclease M5)
MTSASDQDRLQALDEVLSYRLDELLDELGVRVRRTGKLLMGRCPVHGGDNPTAFNLYPEGHTRRGNWYCRSRQCERKFCGNLLGLVRGVLSYQEAGGKPVPFRSALDWACRFARCTLDDLSRAAAQAEKQRFVNSMTLMHRPVTVPTGWSLKDVRAKLAVPSAYFQRRGFTAAVLERFSIGDALTGDPHSPMYGRAVVPVMDREGARVLGVTGRSLLSSCGDCGRHHRGDCPAEDHLHLPQYAKWRHHGFRAEQVLFNLWNAEPHVRRTRTVLLVEGPGDVLRLEEAGFPNAVAVFGNSLRERQQILLESTGAMRVVLLLDADAAGEQGVRETRERLSRAFNLDAPRLSHKDVGETPVAALQQELAPYRG